MAECVRHRVRKGECAFFLAATYGLRRPKDILEHADNAFMHCWPRRPAILAADDEVSIPLRASTHAINMGGEHAFRARAVPMVQFRVCIAFDDKVLAGATVHVRAESNEQTLTTDGDGILRAEIPARATRVELSIPDHEAYFVVTLGALPPIDTLEGIASRLRNLGLFGLRNDARATLLLPAFAQFRAIYMKEPKHTAENLVSQPAWIDVLNQRIADAEPRDGLLEIAKPSGDGVTRDPALLTVEFVRALEQAHGS